MKRENPTPSEIKRALNIKTGWQKKKTKEVKKTKKFNVDIHICVAAVKQKKKEILIPLCYFLSWMLMP